MLSIGRGNFFPAYGTVQQLLKGMYFLCILNVKRRKKHWTAYVNSSASLAWQYLLFKQPKLQNEHGLSRNLNKRKSFAKKHSRTAKQWSPSYRKERNVQESPSQEWGATLSAGTAKDLYLGAQVWFESLDWQYLLLSLPSGVVQGTANHKHWLAIFCKAEDTLVPCIKKLAVLILWRKLFQEIRHRSSQTHLIKENANPVQPV